VGVPPPDDARDRADPGIARPVGHAAPAPVSDEETRAAVPALLQYREVRLSTIHRVPQALLGGSALVLLLPLLLRDARPEPTTLIVACIDAGQSGIAISGTCAPSASAWCGGGLALRDSAAGPRQTFDAVRLFARGRGAPTVREGD
jgi:hypothetical protein